MLRALLFAATVATCLGCAPARQRVVTRGTELMWDVNSDHFNFYTPQRLGALAVGTGFAAALANTPADQEMANLVQRDMRTNGTDSLSRCVKPLGDGLYTIPVFLAAGLLGESTDCAAFDIVGEWGERCWRSTLVGAPPMLGMQLVTGASRPGETAHSSYWAPFQDNNGVSGHSFMGAIPFLCAAQMADDPWLKGSFYAGSTVVAWSRVNDNAHFMSQAMLGWWIAFLATSAVDCTYLEERGWSIQPAQFGDGPGALIMLKY